MEQPSDFSRSLSHDTPPEDVSNALKALWYEKKGDWDAAHILVQDGATAAECEVHAYLHRKEGDFDNARYWYRRGGTKEFSGSLEDEWHELVKSLGG